MKRSVMFGVVLVLALAACSSTPKTTTPSEARATATLKHVPQGTVNMDWSPVTHQLTVKMSLIGLAPTSTHPAHIHKGACGQKGDVVHALTGVKADANVAGSATTEIK